MTAWADEKSEVTVISGPAPVIVLTVPALARLVSMVL